jgi:hypothetical protein
MTDAAEVIREARDAPVTLAYANPLIWLSVFS